GLILGSPEAYGGAAWRLGIDAFSSSGRRSVGLERSLRFDWLPGVVAGAAPAHPDIIYALRVEMMTFHRRADLGFTVIPAVDLNRNMVANHDVFNLTTALTLSG